jgi:DNA ligase-1
MLASDYVESKIVFPVIAQPKIDGVRALNMTGDLTGRSLKKHANKHVTRLFSQSFLAGFDGEMAAESATHPDLCRITSSALSTIEGEPYVLWWLFDYVLSYSREPYAERYEHLKNYVAYLQDCPDSRSVLAQQLRVVPSFTCQSMSELLDMDSMWLEQGYEGTILRSPVGLHKQGRSTVREGGLLRIKRFVDAEIEITEVIEGEENCNEAQTNELGLQFRSTHQSNMIPNGMVGAIKGRLLKDLKDLSGAVLFKEGDILKAGAGCMTKADREFYFRNPTHLISKIAKIKLFPKGVKDKPRFPTFQCLRDGSDL